jgi:Family of unknown function (DUF6328)
MHFRRGAKERLVWMTHRATLLGLVAMAVAMDLGVWLVLARVWSEDAATQVCVSLAVIVVLMWVVWPWAVLRRSDGEGPGSPVTRDGRASQPRSADG